MVSSRWVVAVCLAALAGTVPAGAQTNLEVNQGVQIDFLNPGARSLGMAGAFVGLADDATAALANPAGLRALSRKEVSFEFRARQFENRFVNGGRLAGGTPTGSGIDLTSGPNFATSDSSEQGLSFVSGVYASAARRWTLAAYRHETVRYSSQYRSEGALTADVQTGEAIRIRPYGADLDLTLVNYGVAGSYKFEDRVAIGASLSLYDLSMQAVRSQFANVGFSGGGDFTTAIGQTYQFSDADLGTGFNVGVLFTPTSRFQVGLSYRQQVAFDVIGSVNPPEGTRLAGDTTSSFILPANVTLGVAVRPTRSSVVVVDYARIRHSEQTKSGNFAILIGSVTGDETAANYRADDANEVHIGFEHQFVNARVAPSLRFGTWYDPDHSVRNTTGRRLFQPGTDEWHYTGGLGAVFGRLEVNGAMDISERGNIFSLSAVARF